MKNWKRYFKDYILERGYGYAMDGAVVNIKETEQGILAEVSGTERYDVFIKLSNDTIRSMSCSCPYAESGKHCKHMAAVLFAVTGDELDVNEWDDEYEDEYEHDRWYDDEDEDEDYGYYSRLRVDEVELKRVIDLLSTEDAKHFLFEKASCDYDLAESIFSHYRKVETREMIEELFKKDVSKWEQGLNSFLSDQVIRLTGHGEKDFIIDVLKDVLYRLDEYLVSCESEGVFRAAKKCFTALVQLIGQIPFYREKTQQIAYMKRLAESFRSKALIGCRTGFLSQLKRIDPRFSKLIELDAVINGCRKSNVCSSVLNEDRASVCAVTYRLSLMKQLGFSEQEILDYRSTVRHFHVIRVMEIEEALKCSDAKKALEVIAESKCMDHDEMMIRALSGYAVQAYQMLGDTDSMKKEMKSLVLNTPQFGLENILELKKTLSRNEWKEFLPVLLKSQSLARVKVEVMLMEGMKDQVFKEIQHYHQFIKFEDKLKKLDIYQTQDLLIRFLNQMAEYSNKRSEYKELVQQLFKLIDYPGGHDEIYRIAQNWKIMYKKRPAMMEELSFAFRKWTFLQQR